jgi:hypothetical protein
MSVVAMPAPALGAQLWQDGSPRLPFYLTIAAMLAVLPFTWFKLKTPDKT